MSTRRPSHHPPPETQMRSDPGDAFLRDPYDHRRARARAADALAELLAEAFVQAATSAEPMEEDERDAIVPEEIGGPFTATTAGVEFATGYDPSNPDDAMKEPFPTSSRAL